MRSPCVIFDLDGTLVDSESLCNQAFLDLLPDLHETAHHLTRRYRGLKLAAILADLERVLGRTLPKGFENQYRQRVGELFERDLQPIAGVREMLDATTRVRCIASSGPRSKIMQALEVTGLRGCFDDRFFSSYEIGSWKPDPGLFLHAAQSMGFSAQECVVIEDSDVGIAAAAAAGIRALRYMPESEQGTRSEGAWFSHMADLPGLLAELSNT